jgi:hypothetical protein
MKRRLAASGLAALMLVVALCAVSPTAATAYGPTIAFWDLSEPSGSTVLVDGSGNGVSGTIGSEIQEGNVDPDGATYFHWSYAAPNKTLADADRRITVPSGVTNPGVADFTVALRFRTTKTFGNLIQKGQNGNAGGYWKVEIPKGHVTCLFKGVDGSVLVNSPVGMNDGQWHTITCSRTATGVSMLVDGTTTRSKAGPTGSISNTVPVSIGGKKNCDQVTVTCDFFTGDMDWIRLSTP